MNVLPFLPPQPRGRWRWKPPFGRPRCLVEQATQYLWRHKLISYLSTCATLSLILQLAAAR